jgi:surface-anchored protein
MTISLGSDLAPLLPKLIPYKITDTGTAVPFYLDAKKGVGATMTATGNGLVMTEHLQDGGPGDQDGSANGDIVDPVVLFVTPVTASITGPAADTEGGPVTLGSNVIDTDNASAAFTYVWQVTKSHAGGPATFYQDGAASSFTFTPDDDGTYVVTLAALTTDADGNVIASNQASQTIAVTGVPPTAALSGPTLAVPGQPLTFALSAQTPAAADQAAGFAYTVDWGDGSSGQPDTQTVPAAPGNGIGVNLTHAFTAPGSYTVQLTATNKDGLVSDPVTQTVTVGTAEVENGTLFVGGTSGADLIVITPGPDHQIHVSVHQTHGGNSAFAADFAGAGLAGIVVYGGPNDNTIAVSDAVTLPAVLFGGAGTNLLVGGGGPSILVGGNSTDVLTGGLGRSILIGGGGRDLLVARGDAVLIGGTTDYDGNLTALDAVLAEWASGDSYPTRVSDLLGPGAGGSSGGLNGPYDLDPTTVHDDGAPDTLVGGSGFDLFFLSLGDVLVGKKKGETVIWI